MDVPAPEKIVDAGLRRHDGVRRPAFTETLAKCRDRLLASPKFQSFAAKFPLTRGIARREARALFDICAGFVYAQTLAACMDLDLFEILAAGPMSPETLAARAGMAAPAMRTLLDAAVSLRLLANSGTKNYRLGPLGAASRGNPGIAAMVAHHRLFYADLADPVRLLRGQAKTALADFWPYQGGGDAQTYSALMAASQPMIAREILAAYDFSKHCCVLDIGGGDGSFLNAVAAQAPNLKLRLFDLPGVAVQATERFVATGLAHRAIATGGDVFTDSLPVGADIVTLIRVLHDHDDNRALHLLRAARRALPTGGTLLIAEPMAGTRGATPITAAYFGFYLLAMGSGRARKPSEINDLLQQSGFTAGRVIPTNQPMLTGLMVARVTNV